MIPYIGYIYINTHTYIHPIILSGYLVGCEWGRVDIPFEKFPGKQGKGILKGKKGILPYNSIF